MKLVAAQNIAIRLAEFTGHFILGTVKTVQAFFRNFVVGFDFKHQSSQILSVNVRWRSALGYFGVSPTQPRQQRLNIGHIYRGTTPDTQAWRCIAESANVVGSA